MGHQGCPLTPLKGLGARSPKRKKSPYRQYGIETSQSQLGYPQIWKVKIYYDDLLKKERIRDLSEGRDNMISPFI